MNGGAGAVAGDEGGGLVGDAGLEGEAGGFELVLEQGGGFVLVVAELGEAPDLFGDVFVVRRAPVDELERMSVRSAGVVWLAVWAKEATGATDAESQGDGWARRQGETAWGDCRGRFGLGAAKNLKIWGQRFCEPK